MKRLALLMLSVLYLSVLMFSSVNIAAAQTTDRYGYSLLSNDGQRAAYKAISNGIANLAEPIDFVAAGASTDDVQHAYLMVCRDYPEYFWLDSGTSYTIRYSGDNYSLQNMPYKIDGQNVSANSPALIAAKNQINAVVAAVKASLPHNATDYDKSLVCHDYIVNTVSYEMVGDHQSAYGALVSKKAVCAGYSRAYQLLMNAMGVDCWYVGGMSYDSQNNFVNHGWNLVWLDGKCYYTDTTWDDQGDELYREYLNMSLDEISTTHITNDPLPHSCQHEDYDYFKLHSGNGVVDFQNGMTAQQVASSFVYSSGEGSNTAFKCTIHFHGGDFSSWWDENFGNILSMVGFTHGGACSIMELGNEYHVTLIGEYFGDDPMTPPTEPPTVPTPNEPNPTDAPTQPQETQPQNNQNTQNPQSPQTPQNPSTPAVPNTQPATDPGNPEETDPHSPSQPTQGDVSQPVTSDTTQSKPSQQPSQNQSPDNENNSNPMVYVILCCAVVAIAGAVALVFILKKRK